jgi:hypothetical protein
MVVGHGLFMTLCGLHNPNRGLSANCAVLHQPGHARRSICDKMLATAHLF